MCCDESSSNCASCDCKVHRVASFQICANLVIGVVNEINRKTCKQREMIKINCKQIDNESALR